MGSSSPEPSEVSDSAANSEGLRRAHQSIKRAKPDIERDQDYVRVFSDCTTNTFPAVDVFSSSDIEQQATAGGQEPSLRAIARARAKA